MILDNKTKKFLKFSLALLVLVVLTGCANNLDPAGKLIASRAITETTPWTLSAGWFDFLLVIPMAKAILYFGKLGGNIAFGVILVTIIINIITLPIMIKSTISSQKMQLIQPEVLKIQNKYRGHRDQQSQIRMNQEIQDLYRKNDVSMLGSLTMVITLPIMFAIWQAVQRIKILYDTFFVGFNLGIKPMDAVFKGDVKYIILILIVGITQFFAIEISNMMAKRNPRYVESSQTRQMKTMNRFMTIFIVYFAATMPTAMSLYWITTNIIMIARTYYIQIFHIEKVNKKVEDTNTNYLNKKNK